MTDMRPWAPRLALAATSLALPAQAQPPMDAAPCRLELRVENNVDWTGPLGRGYDVFEPAQSFEVVSVTIRHEGAPCDYFLTGTPDEGNRNLLRGPTGTLTYDVLKQPSGPSILSADFAGDQFSRLIGRFPAGLGIQQATLYVAIPPGQFVGGGNYSGQALLRLFRDDNSGPQLADQAPIGVIAPVASVLRVEPAGEYGSGRDLAVDLGELTRGARREVGFQVTSNSSVSAHILSANRGVLKHHAGAAPIPYRLSVGGRELDLGYVAAPAPLMDAAKSPRNVPFRIEVEPQPGAAAGHYSDYLTVTFTVDQ